MKDIRRFELCLEIDGQKHVEYINIPSMLLVGLSNVQVKVMVEDAAKARVQWAITERL